MSIKIMSRVWDSSPYSGEKLLVLLALADFSNDEGHCFPSVETISKKCRITDRSVFRIIAQFIEEKALTKQPGGGRGVRNTYQFSDDYINTDKKSEFNSETLTLKTRNPDIGSKPPITPNKEEPSLEPSFFLTSQEAKEPSLHNQVKDYILNIYQERFGCLPSWNGSEAKQLKSAIEANPTWTIQIFRRLIDNRYASEGVNGERPRIWLSDLGRYLGGPLDKYGNPKQQSSPVVQREVTISERMRALAAGSSR